MRIYERGRERSHLITSSFDILSLSQRKPATPNRRYREGGLEVGVVRGRGLRVLLAYRMRTGNNLYACRVPLSKLICHYQISHYGCILFFFGGGGGGTARKARYMYMLGSQGMRLLSKRVCNY